VIFTFFTLINY